MNRRRLNTPQKRMLQNKNFPTSRFLLFHMYFMRIFITAKDFKSQLTDPAIELTNFKSELTDPAIELTNFKSQLTDPKSELTDPTI